MAVGIDWHVCSMKSTQGLRRAWRFAQSIVMVALLSACKQAPFVYSTVVDAVGVQSLGADVQSPTTLPPAGGFPVVLLIHGGGWNSKTLYDDGLRTTLARVAVNYVGVTINYRLANSTLNEAGEVDIDGTITRNPWPAQIHDVKCAVSWIRANAENREIFPVEIDINRIGVAGISAGGQLALMLGETSGSAQFTSSECEHDARNDVQAVVSYAGLADVTASWGDRPNLLRPMYQRLLSLYSHDELTKTDFGDLDTETQDLLLSTSPRHFSQGGTVPVRLIHAVNDILSPPSNSQCFYDSVNPAMRDRSLLWFSQGGHTFSRGVREHADAQMLHWFDKHLRYIDRPLACTECVASVPQSTICMSE